MCLLPLQYFTVYAYAKRGKALYINLFVDSETDIVMSNNKISVIQETKYPWEGKVRIRIEPNSEMKFAVHVSNLVLSDAADIIEWKVK